MAAASPARARKRSATKRRDRLGAPSVVARIQPLNGPSIAVATAIGLSLDFRTTGPSGEPVAVYRGVLQNISDSA